MQNSYLAFAQDKETEAMVIYGKAEDSYNEGNYQDVLTKLKRVEQILAAPNSKILYLKAKSLNKLIINKSGSQKEYENTLNSFFEIVNKETFSVEKYTEMVELNLDWQELKLKLKEEEFRSYQAILNNQLPDIANLNNFVIEYPESKYIKVLQEDYAKKNQAQKQKELQIQKEKEAQKIKEDEEYESFINSDDANDIEKVDKFIKSRPSDRFQKELYARYDQLSERKLELKNSLGKYRNKIKTRTGWSVAMVGIGAYLLIGDNQELLYPGLASVAVGIAILTSIIGPSKKIKAIKNKARKEGFNLGVNPILNPFNKNYGLCINLNF